MPGTKGSLVLSLLGPLQSGPQNHLWLLTGHSWEDLRSTDQTWHVWVLKKGHLAASVCKQTILASWPTKRCLFSPAVCLHILHFKCQGTVFQLQYSVRSWRKGEQVLIFTTIKKSYRKHLEGCLALPLTVYMSKHPHLGVPFTILIATSLSVITGLLLKKLQQR